MNGLDGLLGIWAANTHNFALLEPSEQGTRRLAWQ
jgi:hypothetical protein